MPPARTTVDFGPINEHGRSIHIQVDMIHYATHVLTPQLKDPSKPLCCPLCLVLYAVKLSKQDHARILSDLLLHQHSFFAACLAVLAAPRVPSDLPSLRAQLESNRTRCHSPVWHRFVNLQTQMAGDPLGQLVTGLVTCVSGGIRNTEAKGWFKAKARKGSWPTAPEQLLPYGARQSVASYVFWCRALVSAFAVPLVVLLLEVARSDVLPHLLAPPQRDLIMEAMIAMLSCQKDGPAFSSTAGTPLSIWMRPANCPDELLPQKTAASLLSAVLTGTRARLDDGSGKLYSGYERALYAALISALESNTIHDDALLIILCTLAQALHDQLSLPPSQAHAALNERILSCKSRLNMPDGMTKGVQMVYMILYFQERLKTCSGAGCREPGKQTCSRCKLVRYCGRACQQNDWSIPRGAVVDVSVTHKSVCPILCRLRNAGVIVENTTLRQFIDSYHRADISDAEYDELVSWGAVAGFVPPRG